MRKENRKQRIMWMDILRGFLILSVVIGHSTGLFNRYIYQFHMGAFFLVSGYMSRPEKKTVIQTIYHRLLTTYLPVFTATFLLAIVMAWMNDHGWYTLIMGQMQYIGFIPIIKELLINGNLYVWWLGAAWFAVVLFQAAVLNRLVLALNGDKYGWGYFCTSVLLLLLGYIQAEGNNGTPLVLIAHFYFAIGTLLRDRYKPETSTTNLQSWVGLFASGLIMWIIGNYFGFTVDYPSYKFNYPLIDVFMAVNGGMLCYFVAQLVVKVPHVRNLLAYLGRNTLPIMLFHFMWFNVVFWLLYKFDVVPLDYLSNFIPTTEIGCIYWPIFTIVSIFLSILLWKLLTCTKVLRIAWGQEKSVYDTLWKLLIEKIKKVKWAVALENKGVFRLLQKKWQLLAKRGFLSLLSCILIVVILAVGYYDTYYVGSTLESCDVETGFYQDGWCENYVKFIIRTGKIGRIELEGWSNIQRSGEEEIVVYCDGVEAMRYSVQSEQIVFSIPALTNSDVVLEICSNFKFTAEAPDCRELSFILLKLNAF